MARRKLLTARGGTTAKAPRRRRKSVTPPASSSDAKQQRVFPKLLSPAARMAARAVPSVQTERESLSAKRAGAALWLAASRGSGRQLEIVSWLVKVPGLDFDARAKDGTTAEETARARGYFEAAEIISRVRRGDGGEESESRGMELEQQPINLEPRSASLPAQIETGRACSPPPGSSGISLPPSERRIDLSHESGERASRLWDEWRP